MRTLILLFILLLNYESVIASREGAQRKTKEINLLIPNNELVIGGTLTKPKQPQAQPLVIMITGSGPQDRNETVYGFKIFGILAKEMGRKGISSFRYDDRGVKKSTGDFATSTIDDLVGDVEAIIQHFQSEGYEDFILLGHSQGGIIAGKVAAQTPAVKGVVLMASAGVPLGEVILAQKPLEHKDSGIDENLIEEEIRAHELLMKSIYYGEKVDEAVEVLEKSILNVKRAQTNQDESEITKAAKDLASRYQVAYSSPSLATFLFYDPVEDLRQLSIPVLGVYGGKDMQTMIDQNIDRIEGAMDTEYEAVVFENANHLFQEAQTGLIDEYEGLEKAFTDGFSESIYSWILKYFE